eukprot:scaffold149229_cov60-Attheya_sp.AAC.2
MTKNKQHEINNKVYHDVLLEQYGKKKPHKVESPWQVACNHGIERASLRASRTPKASVKKVMRKPRAENSAHRSTLTLLWRIGSMRTGTRQKAIRALVMAAKIWVVIPPSKIPEKRLCGASKKTRGAAKKSRGPIRTKRFPVITTNPNKADIFSAPCNFSSDVSGTDVYANTSKMIHIDTAKIEAWRID